MKQTQSGLRSYEKRVEKGQIRKKKKITLKVLRVQYLKFIQWGSSLRFVLGR